MDIGVGKWRIVSRSGSCFIENTETGIPTKIDRHPHVGNINAMSLDTCIRKCAQAYATGVWPMTTKTCNYCGMSHKQE